MLDGRQKKKKKIKRETILYVHNKNWLLTTHTYYTLVFEIINDNDKKYDRKQNKRHFDEILWIM